MFSNGSCAYIHILIYTHKCVCGPGMYNSRLLENFPSKYGSQGAANIWWKKFFAKRCLAQHFAAIAHYLSSNVDDNDHDGQVHWNCQLKIDSLQFTLTEKIHIHTKYSPGVGLPRNRAEVILSSRQAVRLAYGYLYTLPCQCLCGFKCLPCVFWQFSIPVRLCFKCPFGWLVC